MEDIKIQTISEGYKIEMNSLYSYRFKNASPSGKASKFYIQLKTVDHSKLDQEDLDIIHSNLIPSWDHSSGIPLNNITFDGNDTENPQIILDFNEDVTIDVHDSADMKTVTIRVTTAQPPQGAGLEARKAGELALPEAPLDQPESSLMREAKDALVKPDYDAAVQLYLKVLLTAQGELKKQARELLGVARERNKQLAHAAAEYSQYLKEYPEGPDADRVRQRLAGVVTSTQAAQAPLKEPAGASRKIAESVWSSQYFGSASQYYYRDMLKIKGSKQNDTLNNLASDVDINGRWKSRDLEIKARFSGGKTQNYLSGSKNENRLSAMAVDIKSKKLGFYARAGRQTLSTGGVLGRFDGVHVSKQITPGIKLNVVSGYPVDSVKISRVITQKLFEGINIDWGIPKARWTFNTFAIAQQNSGLTDRQAVGGEVRYFDRKKSLFTLVDYDTYFQRLNIASTNMRYTLPTKTTLSLTADYRKSPLITTNNAIQGMGVANISDLKSTYTRKELRQLAIDRSTNSKSATAGVSQDIRENLQWTGEVSVSALEGMITSGGVEGSNSTGPDWTYSTELNISNLIKEQDSLIPGLVFTDAQTYYDYAFNLNARYPLTAKTRINPRFHTDFKDTKASADERWAYRPEMRLEYSLTKFATLEIDGGTEWVSEIASGIKSKSREMFITTGYRLIF